MPPSQQMTLPCPVASEVGPSATWTLIWSATTSGQNLFSNAVGQGTARANSIPSSLLTAPKRAYVARPGANPAPSFSFWAAVMSLGPVESNGRVKPQEREERADRDQAKKMTLVWTLSTPSLAGQTRRCCLARGLETHGRKFTERILSESCRSCSPTP